MTPESAISVVSAYLNANIPAFMWGAPGIGKSDIVRALSAKRGGGLIDLRAVLLDPVDLRGLPAVENRRAFWAQPEFLPRVDRDGETGILFLDELNAAPQSTQAACFQLVLDRKLGEYTMPEGWRIIAAGNRQSDRAAAQRMPSALANRFAHVDVEADVKSWCTWANAAGVNPIIIGFIRFRPDLLHLMPGQEPASKTIPMIPADAKAFPTPRSISQAAAVCDAPDDIRLHLISGLCGEGFAAEFEGYYRVFRTLPTIADIIANPDRINIPSDPGTVYAVSAALSRKADRTNFAPIIRFANRALGTAHTVMLVVDAVKRDAGLKTTSAFIQWASDNAEVTI